MEARNDKLIAELREEGYLKTRAIISAFAKIKREDFVRPGDKSEAAINAPLPIGKGQTISQPLTVAFMLELLEPKRGDKILDVGTGSGWTPALLAEIVGPEGKIYGLEIIPELKEFGEKNLEKYGFIKEGRAQIILGSGYIGLPDTAPFDKILVSAASEEIPENLLKQLKTGGTMVIPIGRQYETQTIFKIKRVNENEFIKNFYPGFSFVPLIKVNL